MGSNRRLAPEYHPGVWLDAQPDSIRWSLRLLMGLFQGRTWLVSSLATVALVVTWWDNGLLILMVAARLLVPVGPPSIIIIPIAVASLKVASLLLAAGVLVYASAKTGWVEGARMQLEERRDPQQLR